MYAEHPKANSENVSYFQGNFVEQGWENCYDYIICTQFDEWDDDPDKLFDAIRKALKPGGKAIILICTDFALPGANSLQDWLAKSENQEYAPFLRFWSNIDCWKLRLLKYPDFPSVYGKLQRMIPCFRSLEQFREESRKWFRKIATLPMPLQDVALNHLVEVTEKNGTFYLDGEDFYIFYYNLEVACRQKAG